MSSSSSRAISDFLGEAEEIIENLNNDLILLDDCAAQGNCDPDLLNRIFRGAHSLKGLAGMFGFDDIASLAHHLENLLDHLRLGKIPLGDDLVQLLTDGFETLSRLVEGKGENPDFTFDVTAMRRRVEQFLAGDDAEKDVSAMDRIDPEILAVLTEFEEHRLRENLKNRHYLFKVKVDFDLASFDQELSVLTDLLKKEGEVISTLPLAADLTDRIAFQLLFGTDLAAAELEALVGPAVAVENLLPPLDSPPSVREMVIDGEPEGVTDQEPAVDSTATESSARSISRTVRVDIDKLDLLMNVVGELVLAKAAIARVCEKLKGDGVTELASELQKATRVLERRLEELQKGVMEVRMVPVAQLFDKMNRIVRKVARELGKQIALEIRGADTELDKLIVEDLSDPLMHIIRNAIDHGIESPEERRLQGKAEKGVVSLTAAQKGNHVVIEVRDDGRGIDPEKVRRKAVERGLIPETAKLSREQVYDLLFMPGFSTAETVSDLSGRGVGMDVVKNNIALLSGMIELDSEVGMGTSIAITLPITLAIIKALIIRIGDKTYAIPINSVMETMMVEASAVRTIERKEVIELRESTLPLLWLGDIFQLNNRGDRRERFFVAVVGFAEKKIGIVVDELLGQQDVVIKSLGESLAFVQGFAGAADLGNQKTILVLDVGGLMSETLRGDSAFFA
ncbi:chemotaxis protein CheA [Trichloromonas sp.]|uniref:chemotaxis protein CheA n=1 Tax=Trichloromonas sp. TaxID=3069249 RepID=UPI002A3F4F9C|nr:chemotaxis protein CheA [Trichloromonas sp.]